MMRGSENLTIGNIIQNRRIQTGIAVGAALASLGMLSACTNSEAAPAGPYTAAASPSAVTKHESKATPKHEPKVVPKQSSSPTTASKKQTDKWEFNNFTHRDGYADCIPNLKVSTGLVCTAERSGIFLVGGAGNESTKQTVSKHEKFNLTLRERSDYTQAVCVSLPLVYEKTAGSAPVYFDSLDTCAPKMNPPVDSPSPDDPSSPFANVGAPTYGSTHQGKSDWDKDRGDLPGAEAK